MDVSVASSRPAPARREGAAWSLARRRHETGRGCSREAESAGLEPKDRIDVGFSPGDNTFGAPFLFVRCPDGPARPVYDGPGLWMRIKDQFTGAVLPGPDVVAAGDAAAQHELVRAFFQAALANVG